MARGLETKEIAAAMNVSQSTAKTYLHQLRHAIGVHNRVELCMWAVTHPRALAGAAAPRGLHPIGCQCGSPYCSAIRNCDQAA